MTSDRSESVRANASFGVPRKILVAVSDGGLSDAAVMFANELAEAARAELDLLHALPVPTLVGLRLSEKECAALEAERKVLLARDLSAALAKAALPEPASRSLTERLRVVAGQPPKVVLEEARAKGVDLVVLGTSGKKNELDFGGVARAVLSQAPCPVLLVPATARRVRKILVPVDLSPASLRALGVARDWARMLGAKVLAIHCFSVPELVAYGIPEAPIAPMDFGIDELRASAKERFEREMRAFSWGDVPWDARLYDDTPEQTLSEIQDDYDLMVLSTHGHTGLAAALLGSVAYTVLRRARIPSLACPIRD
ncbi:MAG TPA: universal stress protein [Planctomycetota bacterium]|nr:universal stress protein [Planctomycetota bacterium]